jgi:iron complex outermembrane receptor protein
MALLVRHGIWLITVAPAGATVIDRVALAQDAPTTPVADHPAPDAATLEPAHALGTVVVTARYRAEDVQDVPIPITTLSGEQLQALGGTRDVNQLAAQLPSLNIQGYSGRNQTITIRGLGTNAGSTNDGLEQGVGLYIDGVYRPRTGSVITDLVDVESIQLLRGPQGTLFGKNTVAGALDIRTLEPGFERVVKAEATYGNYNYARAYISLTNPLSEDLTFRVSYLRTARDGIIYNTTFKQNWDDLNNDAVRGDVVWKPSRYFKTRLIADYSMQVCNCGFNVVRQVLPDRLADGRQVRGFYQRAADVGYEPIPIAPFARRTDIDASQYDHMPSWGVQNRADVHFDSDISLTSISAYRNWKWLPNFDGDQIGADVSPLGVVETHQQQFSQELRLASPGGQLLDYTTGLYFFWQRANDYQYSSFGSQASGWSLSATTPREVLDRLVAFSHVIPQTFSYAAYGQATLNPTPSWHITAGLRATFEHKTGSYDAYPQGAVAPIDSLPTDIQASAAMSRASVAPTGKYEQSRNVDNLSWTAIAAHDFGQDVHVFGSYSRGYKSPGINLVAQTVGVNVFVDPETVDDFELGSKASFFEGRVEINPTLFYAIDRNYQASFVNTDVARPVQYIANVGTVLSRGVELDVRTNPVQGLTAAGSLTFDDARYASYKNAPAQYLTSYQVTQDLSGRRASGAPRWTAGAMIEYAVPLAPKRGDASLAAYVGGDWSLRGNFRAAVNLDPFSQIPGYQLIGLHAGLRHGSAWDVSIWVRNLLDTDYFNTTSINANYGVTMAALGEPRTFGATVRGTL